MYKSHHWAEPRRLGELGTLTTHTPFERRHHASGEFPGSERHGGDRRSDWRLEVATSHLYWDPRFPDLKLLQARLCEARASSMGCFFGGVSWCDRER